jgi:hypothetical protein
VASETAATVAIFGSRAAHPSAALLAAEVRRLLFRYAHELVAAHALCPFLHNVEVGMGSVGVILEVEPDAEAVLDIMRQIGSPVQHLAFPIFRGSSSAFERFGSKLANLVQRQFDEPLVHATFHPELVGGTENAYRLIGLLRQAPDPFIQFIPHGLQKGGTVLAASREGAKPEESHADARFRRLTEGALVDDLLATIRALKDDRARSYAALADEIAS